jgi:WD40 repeat protein
MLVRTIALPFDECGHAAPITHVAFRADGRRLATSSYDGSVLIWDVREPATPVVLHRLKHRRLVNASAWNPAVHSLIATASADKTVAVWSVADGREPALLNVLARHTDDINSVAWLPDGERLICVSEDGRATMWDALSGRLLGEAGSHAAHCMMVAVSAAGLVATVGEDGLVAVTDIGGEPGSAGPPVTRRYDSSIEGCAWSRDGRLLAVARDDGAVDLLTSRLDLVRTVPVSTSAARAVDWSEDGRSFVVGAYDGALHTFDVDGNRLHTHHDPRLWPRSVATRDGLVAAGSFWNGPHLLDLSTAAPVASPRAATHGPNALAVAGGELLVGTDSGLVLRVSAATGEARPPLRLTDGPILSLATVGRNFATGGTDFATGGTDFATGGTDFATGGDAVYAGTYAGRVVRDDGAVSDQLGAPVPSLVRTGDALVAGTYNGELVRLDPATLRVLDRWTAHGGSVKSLARFGDGFLSAATDRTVAGGSFRDRDVLWQHGNLVNSVAALGDRIVATASRDHTVKVGRFGRDGHLRQSQTLLGPDESVKCVALLGDPGAPLVLAGSYDFGLYVWRIDWEGGGLVDGRVLEPFSQGVSCMARIDSSHVAVAGWDGRVLVLRHDGAGGVETRWSRPVSELVADLPAVAPAALDRVGAS